MGFCGDTKQADPKEMDPLYSQSGGQALRKYVFDALPGIQGRAGAGAQEAIAAARTGARAMAPVGQFGRSVMRGDYLRSPLLDRSLAATRAASNTAAQAGAADARANLASAQNASRAQFSRAGQTFGTGNQLAQEGTAAALEAQIGRQEAMRQAAMGATEAQTQAENYARERGLQMAAPQIVSSAASRPVEMLQAIPGLEYAGYDTIANLVKTLASGAPPAMNGNQYYKPGAGDYILQGLGAAGAASAAGLL
jgi:hypothetical protein